MLSAMANAQWLWCGDASPNQFAGFVRPLELSTVPASARLWLFADTKYKLYVNGRFVQAGPAPFRKPVVSVDELDLKPWLTSGDNTIFILVCFIGFTTKYNTVDRPGVIASLMLDDRQIVTDQQWQAYPMTAWTAETPKKNWAIERVEEIQLADPSFSVLCTYATEDYARADQPVRLPAAHVPTVVEPPADVECRLNEVPLLRWRREDAVLSGVFRLNCEVYNLQDTPVRLAYEHAVPAWDQDVYEMTRHGDLRLQRACGEPGYGLLYDMRRMCAGDVSVEIQVDSACTLDIGLAEALRGGRPDIWRTGGHYFARFHLQAGLNRCRFYHFNGHRYLYLVLKDLEGDATVHRVTTHHCRADLDFSDSFHAVDPTARSIYAISRRSLMLNTQANAYDCNTREQGAYWGDGLWILDAVGHLTGNFAHMRQMCRALPDELAATGTLSASLYGLGAPLWDYCLVAVDFLRRYLRFTGDRETVEGSLPAAEHIVEDFRQLRNEDGFVTLNQLELAAGEFRKALLFLDHPGLGWHPRTTIGIDRDDVNAGLNLFYLQALQALEYIYRTIGSDQSLQSEIDALTTAIRSHFLVPETGLLAQVTGPGKESPTYSQIVNALAVMTGVLTGEEARFAMRQVVDIERHRWIAQSTPYGYFFICEALSMLGLADLGVATIKQYWTPMLDRGATTTWEAFGGENHDSLNHAWSAPLPYLLRRGVIGLEATEPGYGSLSFRPCLAAFDEFSHTCSIPQGPVTVAWRRLSPTRYELDITIPAGVSASLHCLETSHPFLSHLHIQPEISAQP